MGLAISPLAVVGVNQLGFVPPARARCQLARAATVEFNPAI